MNAVAKVLRAGQRLRRGLLPALLFLPLLAGFAAGAHAQTLSVSAPANANEGDSSTRVLEFPVTLSSAASSITLYKVCFTGTATIDMTQVASIPAGADYQAWDTSGNPPVATSSNCLNDSIVPNSVNPTNSISIRVKGDTIPESDETVVATLTGLTLPSGVTLGTSTATHTIQNDDGPVPEITISGGAAVTEGGNARFTVNANPAPTVDLTVIFTISEDTSGGQEFLHSNIRAISTFSTTISANQTSATFDVLTLNDSTDEPNGSVTLTLNAGLGYTIGTPSSASMTVNDNDAQTLSTTDFITPSANADLTGPEGDRRHFAILRNVVTGSGIVPSSNAYGFQLCFTGTARPNVDYSVTNHGNHPLEIDRNGCSKANDGDQGTARPAGFDRTNFYIHYWRDGETEGDESIIVTLKNAMGTNLYGDDSRKVSYGNSLTFTIKDPTPQPRCEAARSTDSYARTTYGALIDKMCEWSDQAWGEHRRNWDRALLAFGVGQPRYSQSACQAERDGDDDRYIRDGLLQDYSCGPMKAEEAQVYADKPWRGWYEEVGGHTVASALRDLESRSPQTEDGTSVGDGDSTKDGNTDNVNAQSDNTPPASCVSDAQWSTVAGYYDSNANRPPNYGANWYRVLIAYRRAYLEKAPPDWEGATARPTAPYTVSEAEDGEEVWSGWTPVREVLECLEKPQTPAPQPEPPPPPPLPDPELSLSAGTAVEEGTGASFMIHADAAPAADLTVSVAVAQSGDWLDSPGAGTRAVTLAAGATTASIDVATINDSVDEPDGSVSVTLGSGAGYTVAASPHDTATVAVRDDDDPPPAIPVGSCVGVPQWKTVKGYYDANADRSPNYGANWYRVLIAYRRDRGDQTLPAWTGQTAEPATAFTAKEAEDEETVWSGWTPVRGVLECLERTYGGTSTSSVIGATPDTGPSGEVGTANPDPASEGNRWNPQTVPGGFEPDVMPDFAAGSCVSPRLRSEATARARETWRGAAHVERWLRVARTFSGGANDATVVTPAEAGFHAAADQPGWLPVADALRCMERQSLREALSR